MSAPEQTTTARSPILLLLLLLFSCHAQNDSGRQRVVIGLNPSERSENVARNARVLDSLLQERTGLDIEIYIAHDYSGLVEAMRGETIDFAFFAPVSYVFAERVAGARVLLKAERRGQPYYYGCVVVHTDSSFDSIDDLRGREIAWVDPTSASGHIFPKAALVERGIDPDQFFRRQTFAGGHDAVLLSVINGTISAGATYANDTMGIDGSWAQLGDGAFADRVRPIFFSRAIPGDNLTVSHRARTEMPEVVETLRRGVMELSHDTAGARLLQDLYHVDAMIPATPADYDPVRDAAELLDLDISGRIAAGAHGSERAAQVRRVDERNRRISTIVVAVVGALGLTTLIAVTIRDRRHRPRPIEQASAIPVMTDEQFVIRSLGVEYDRGEGQRFLALDDVNMRIRRGEFVAVIGLSGAGKSTLLRALNGTVRPTSGEVLFEGVDMGSASGRRLAEARRRIGFIFQQFNLVRNLTALANVLTGRLGHRSGLQPLLGRFPAADRKLALDLLTDVGLAQQALQRVDTLSGGQQQRVAIARALVQEPTAILADEPMASLDPRLSEVVLDILKRINRERGITVIVNLHVMDLARSYADRIIALREGQIVYDGRPDLLSAETIGRIYT